jgi:serine protease Do
MTLPVAFPVSRAIAAGEEISAAETSVGVPDFSKITRRYGPTVVNISIRGMRQVSVGPETGKPAGSDDNDGDTMQEFLRRFQQQFGGTGASMQVPIRGQGSGFIVSPDGLILTNAHVIANANDVFVKLTDRREFHARVIGSDKKTDIAVLKIDAHNLPTINIGNPDALQVGEWVLAIGAPYGFENSVSAGVVSAKGRSLPDGNVVPFIQTDVAINPGNSGGPLFNARGEVVGINSQIYSRTGGFQGLSFAIPIDLALKIQQQIVTTGHASHGMLGVNVQEVNQALAEAFRLPSPVGAILLDIQPGSPGAKAGLQPGDVILGINDKLVTSAGDIQTQVTMAQPGQRLIFNIWRDGQGKRLPVTLGDAGKIPAPQTAPGMEGEILPQLGLQLRPLLAMERLAIGTNGGMMVEAVSGPAQAAGILAGDVLLSVNGKPVTSIDQLRNATRNAKGPVALLMSRSGERLFVAVSPGNTTP